MRLRRRRRRPAVPALPLPVADPSTIRPRGHSYVIAESQVDDRIDRHVLELQVFEHTSWVSRGKPITFPIDGGEGGLGLVVLDWFACMERRDRAQARRIAAFIERWQQDPEGGLALD